MPDAFKYSGERKSFYFFNVTDFSSAKFYKIGKDEFASESDGQEK